MAAIYRSCNPQELLNACGKPGFQGRERALNKGNMHIAQFLSRK
jgi:hypothetical protein